MKRKVSNFGRKLCLFGNFKQNLFTFSKSSASEDESLLKSLFAASCQQFVKSVGHRTLKPLESIDVKDNIKPYQLVVKATKRKFIFFEKAFYYPTEFQLTDILTDTSPLKTNLSSATLISEYNRQAKVALKGKICADITKDILAVELATKDSVLVNIEFDEVSKQEAKEPLLMKELNTRFIDLNHPYIRQIREDDSKILCVVSGVANLETGGTIQRTFEVGGSATVKASLIKKASVSGGATYSRNKDIGLAPGTPVAYSVHELMVDSSSGAMSLVLAVGSTGGFVEGLDQGRDIPSRPVDLDKQGMGQNVEQLDLDIRHPRKVFKPLLELRNEQRTKLTTDLLYLMSVPRDLILLDKLFDEVESGTVSSVSLSDLEKRLLSPTSRWLGLLQLAGFDLNADILIAPSLENNLFQCIGEFLDAVTTLEDDDISLLRLCSADNALLLCQLIVEGMRGGQVLEKTVIEPLIRDEVANQILQGLGFQVTSTEIIPPTNLPFSIDEILWVLFSLWGKD